VVKRASVKDKREHKGCWQKTMDLLNGLADEPKGKHFTTARGDRMQGMKAIVSILHHRSHLRQLGSDEKISVKKMISELKSIA